MNPRAITVVALLAVAATVAITAAPVTATMQDGGSDNNTTTPTPDASTNPDPGTETGSEESESTPANDTGDEPEYEERLDRFVVIESYTYDEEAEKWRITFRAEEPGTVTVTEAAQFEEGSGTISIVQERVPRGATTVTLDAPLRAGESAVVITSGRSIDAERAVYLSTGQSGDNPFGTTGTMGWLGGASVVFAMGVWAFRNRLRGGSGGPEEVWD